MSSYFEKFVEQFKKCSIEQSHMIFEAYKFNPYTAYCASIGTDHEVYITYWMQYFRVEALAQGIPTWEINYLTSKYNVRDFAELFKNQFTNYLVNKDNDEFLNDFKKFVLTTQSQGNYELIEQQIIYIMKKCQDFGQKK
jgi:hypothetical protein